MIQENIWRNVITCLPPLKSFQNKTAEAVKHVHINIFKGNKPDSFSHLRTIIDQM